MQSAKARGFRTPDKNFYDVVLKESSILLPSRLEKMAKDLMDEYPFVELRYEDLGGTVEKGADGWVLTARGSNQKFRLELAEGIRLPEGASRVSVSGGVTQDKAKKDALPRLKVDKVSPKD